VHYWQLSLLDPQEKEALESGCDAYLAKPISLDNLLRTIESFCR